jgi:hypothetical protein
MYDFPELKAVEYFGTNSILPSTWAYGTERSSLC